MSPLPSRTTQRAPSCALGPTSANGLFPTRKARCFLGPRKVGGSCWATAPSCPLPRRSSLTVVNRGYHSLRIAGAIWTFVTRILANVHTHLSLTAHRRISCAGRPRGHTARNQVRQFHSAETSRFHISCRLAAVSGCLELPHS